MEENPDDAAALAEAKAAADGDTVKPITGAEVTPDMVLRHNGKWLPVRFKSTTGEMIRIDFAMEEPGSTALRFAKPDSKLYRRIKDGE